MPTGPDPYTESGAVSIPAEYDRLDPVEDGATPTDVDRIWFPTTGG